MDGTVTLTAGGGKGGKAGEGGDAAGISTAEKRALDVQRDALKRRTDALDKKRQRIHDDYKDDLPEPLSTADQFNEDAKAARAVKVEEAKKRKADALKALDKEAAEIADREAALDARMTNTEGSTAANPKPKPTGGAGRTRAHRRGARRRPGGQRHRLLCRQRVPPALRQDGAE